MASTGSGSASGPATTPATGSYATAQQLADYLGLAVGALPSDATRLIARASELIDYISLDRVDLTNTRQTDRVPAAVCAQVEYWITNGETSKSVSAMVESYKVGQTQVNYSKSASSGAATGGQSHDVLAPRAKQALFLAGLLYAGISSGSTNVIIPENKLQ